MRIAWPRLEDGIVWRIRILVLVCSLSGVAGWALSDRLGVLLQIVGSPVAASAGALSGHDLEELNAMAPQDQAARLFEKAINHYRGAGEEITKRLDGWTGKMAPSKELEKPDEHGVLLQRSAGARDGAGNLAGTR